MKKLTGPLLMIGIPEKESDLLFVTRFYAPDDVVWMRHEDSAWMVVPAMEVNRARSECPHLRVLTPRELSGKKRSQPSDWALALLRREGWTRCVVPDGFPLGAARRLEKAGIRVYSDASMLLRERMIKTPGDLAHMRRSQEAAAGALRMALAVLRSATVGAQDRLQLDGRALTSERLRGMVDVFLLGQGYTASHTIVAGGLQSYDPHQAGSGPLHAGQPIILDIFPRCRTTGYWGDLTRTVVKGKATPGLRAMYRAVCGAQRAALRMARPGVAARAIHEAVLEHFEARGFHTDWSAQPPSGFIHSTGHGVGLDIHEAPRLSLLSDAVLEAGMVVTVEPGLYYPEIGGARMEDTIEITPTGWSFLARAPRTFEL